MADPDTSLEERIRRRAYQIWERGGRRDGQAEDHWGQAAREIEAEAGGETGSPASGPEDLEKYGGD